MKKNLRVRQHSALARRAIDLAMWQVKKNPHSVSENRADFENMRRLKIERAASDVKNLEAKLQIG